MDYILTAGEAKEIDRYTIEEIGIPGIVLMERASLETAGVILERSREGDRIQVFSGVGNNGADGLAIARILHQHGRKVDVFLLGNVSRATIENKIQQDILKKMGIHIDGYTMKEGQLPRLTDEKTDVIVDAMFGVGLTRNLREEYLDLLKQIQEKQEQGALVVAVDIPSGIMADNGAICGGAVKADVTVTFGYRKRGLLLYPGAEYAGEVIVREIGFVMPKEIEKEAMKTVSDCRELPVPKRKNNGNKGTFGRVLIVAGSKGMCGAAYLAAKAAYRTGAGLVRIFTAAENLQVLQTLIPEAIMTVYDSKLPDLEELREAMRWATAIVAGPGLSTKERSRLILETILEEKEKPVVLDADALNLLAEYDEMDSHLSANMILTPHLGEMSRLTKKSVSEIQSTLVETAKEFAASRKVSLVLKDARSVIVTEDGCFLNMTGCNGMATGGSGDCLAGIIGGLLAQGMRLADAAVAGPYIHGKSGETAARVCGNYGMTSRDLPEMTGEVMKVFE